VLDQLPIAFFQRAVFLLDAQHLPGAVQHHEVDLAIDRVALVLPGPMYPMKYRIGRRQMIAQDGEGGISGTCAPDSARRVRSEGMMVAMGWDRSCCPAA
jgi:hypothetical protein